jgi:hypothetical protein
LAKDEVMTDEIDGYDCEFDTQGRINPIVRRRVDDTWWFYTECWDELRGPYTSKAMAQVAIIKYAKKL